MMKKWICKNESCGKNCTLSIDYQPTQCPRGLVWVAKWQEKEELNKGLVEKALREAQEKIAGKSPALPKLTAEVFDRPDCPKWAKWAAVDPSGDAYFYIEKPQASSNHWCVPVGCEFFYINRFDASDWRNSLIERPAVLPDWCKVGAWVYLSNAKYYKIEKVDSYGIILAGGIVIKTDDIHAEAVSARLRPYNAEEMKALVGKVIVENKSGDIGLVIGYCNRKESVYAGRNGFVAALLLSDYTIDGKPCGVLEHRENGEWVE